MKNREIKFRVWKYHHTLEQHVMRDITNESVIYLMDNEAFPDRVIMQYTGLKDLNGIEIYEGDIVKIETELAKSFNIDSVAPITFWRGQFYANNNAENLAGLSVIADYNGQIARCEVIGDIYQNPELI